MADDDNFDIDIYGDEQPEFVDEPADQVGEDPQQVQDHLDTGLDGTTDDPPPNEPETEPQMGVKDDIEIGGTDDNTLNRSQPSVSEQPHEEQRQQIASTLGIVGPQLSVPRHAPRQQGAKLEEGAEDGRDTDAGATAALRLGDLHWWMTEDDIRGWANQCQVENEVKEVTFNEHKVNGKSKGYPACPSKLVRLLTCFREVFVELQTPQGATALKRHIDGFGNGQQHVKKHTVIYVRPDYNPFKTYPKDAPARNKETFKDRQSSPYNAGFNNGGGFRGGRGNFNNNRGGMNNASGYGNQGRGGYQNPQMGMMGGGGYGGMNNMPNMGMNAGGFGGQMNFNRGGGMMGMNRGGFGGNRGGRGGMMNNMGMTPQMGMGAMGNMGNMGMGPMAGMGGMGMGGGLSLCLCREVCNR